MAISSGTVHTSTYMHSRIQLGVSYADFGVPALDCTHCVSGIRVCGFFGPIQWLSFDSKARVLGVQSLRVVDASSFLILIPGHPQSFVSALAEKSAGDIMTMA